ncbi:ABC transporter ATP-binding protein [Brenneria goodwinii]|uniref:ABC transporter transmembrane domain-containing protein n=1 Tax=Brenneria goodwinii TaxID=1109412 RepID=UPI0036E17EE0
MTPPGIFDDGRGRQIVVLVVLALMQALALAAIAVATRAAFSAINDGSLPAQWPLMLAGAGLALAILRPTFRVYAERLGQDYACAVRLALFEHAARSPASALARRRKGYLILRFVGDISALKGWPGLGLPRLIESGIVLPAAIAVLFWLEPVFGLIGLAVTVAMLVALSPAGCRLIDLERRLRARRARLAADMAERLPLAPALDMLGRRRREAALIRRRSRDLMETALAARIGSEAIVALPEALAGIAGAAILWFGTIRGLPASMLAAGLATLGLTIAPMRDLTGNVRRVARWRVARENLARALSGPQRPARAVKRLDVRAFTLDIAALPLGGDAPLDLHVAAGGRVILPPGTDMEALARVLSGVEPVEKGRVLLQGVDITGVSPGTLRRGVSVLTAAPVVLRGSLRRVLTLGLSDRPQDEAILRRLKIKGLDGVLASLGGLDRHIAEGAQDVAPTGRFALSALRAALERPALILVAERVEDTDIAAWLDRQKATCLFSEPTAQCGAGQ